jgi:hypothetical protein
MNENENGKEEIIIECDKGHEYQIPVSQFQPDSSCPECSAPLHHFIRTELPDRLVDVHDVLVIQCDKGHLYKTTYDEFERGIRCKVCFVDGKKCH